MSGPQRGIVEQKGLAAVARRMVVQGRADRGGGAAPLQVLLGVWLGGWVGRAGQPHIECGHDGVLRSHVVFGANVGRATKELRGARLPAWKRGWALLATRQNKSNISNK